VRSQFVEVDRLLLAKQVQAEVVEGQEGGAEEAAESLVDRVIDVSLSYLAEVASS